MYYKIIYLLCACQICSFALKANAEETKSLGTLFYSAQQRNQMNQGVYSQLQKNENNSQTELSNNHLQNQEKKEAIITKTETSECSAYYRIDAIIQQHDSKFARVLLSRANESSTNCELFNTSHQLSEIATTKHNKYYLKGKKIEVGDVILLKK